MRRYEIDWLRNISILTLFVYHTAVIFDNMGSFFVKSETPSIIATAIIASMFFWYMPLLFFLAGASTYFALKHKSNKEYIKERSKKLLIPLVIGILTVVPVQVYYALKWRNVETGNIFEFYKKFLFHFTDFKGIDGAFTPAHLWFLIFLFLISIIAIPCIKILNKDYFKRILLKFKNNCLNYKGMAILCGLIFLMELIPRLGDKSITQNLLVFLTGYLCYSDIEVLNIIKTKRKKNLFFSIIGICISLIIYSFSRSHLDSRISLVILVICTNFVVFSTILTVVGYGIRYLNKSHWTLDILNKHGFNVYILHQPFLIGCAYYILPIPISTFNKILLIILISVSLTTFACILLKIGIKQLNHIKIHCTKKTS